MKYSALKAAVVASIAIAPAASAQSGPRWQGWIGCWNAVSNSVAWDSNNGGPKTLCVAPTPDLNAAQIITIADGKVVSRDLMDASGKSRPINSSGCIGTEQARFSADARRVFLRSSVDCQGSRTETSALLAVTSDGDWIDVRSVASGGASSVRVARYRDTGIPRDLPAEVLTALGQRSIGAPGARMATSAPFGNDAIIEASKLVDAGVVEGWVMESGQLFPVDAATLSQLADAGVPGTITDAMIAISKPRGVARTEYRLGRNYPAYGRGASDYWDQDTGERIVVVASPAYDPWGYGFGYGYPYGLIPLRSYGYSGYGIGYSSYGLGFGYGFGHGYRNRSLTGYYYPPTIVLHQDTGAGRGQAVKGEGYTAGRTASPASGQSTASKPSSANSGSSNSGSSNSGSSNSGSSASAPSGAPTQSAPASPRTAKTKP